jgi:hypothetical protein
MRTLAIRMPDHVDVEGILRCPHSPPLDTIIVSEMTAEMILAIVDIASSNGNAWIPGYINLRLVLEAGG